MANSQYGTSTVHIKLEFHAENDPARVWLFHSLLKEVDTSWPWVPTLHYKGRTVCTTCGGRVLHSPSVVPQDVKAAARQAGIRVRIVHWFVSSKCYGPGRYYSDTVSIHGTEAEYGGDPRREQVAAVPDVNLHSVAEWVN